MFIKRWLHTMSQNLVLIATQAQNRRKRREIPEVSCRKFFAFGLNQSLAKISQLPSGCFPYHGKTDNFSFNRVLGASGPLWSHCGRVCLPVHSSQLPSQRITPQPLLTSELVRSPFELCSSERETEREEKHWWLVVAGYLLRHFLCSVRTCAGKNIMSSVFNVSLLVTRSSEVR